MEPNFEDLVTTCVRFSRQLSEAQEPARLLPTLANVAVEHLGVAGAVVFQVTGEGIARVSASRRVPAECCQEIPVELIGQELEERLLEASAGHFRSARTVPLVSGSNLYGALVLLFESPDGLRGLKLRLAQGLAGLAAVALDQAFHREALKRSMAELRASREMLARTERLRAMGELSASIAHDLRNIFHPLLLQVAVLRRRAEEPEAVRASSDMLERVVRRGLETVERLRLFGHQSMEQSTETVDLDALVDEALELCKPRLERRGERLRLRVEHGGPLGVRAHGTELITALVNLVLNAEEAMPEGGTLTVRTGSAPGQGWLQVSDTGVGMGPEVLEHIFEPFFTTKGKAGTGLGLPMVRAFVQRSGGELTVESQPGQGTVFTLSFPLAPQPQSAPGASP